jgi:hypothetical protein
LDTSQEQRKRKVGEVGSSGVLPRGDVFDQLGNDQLLAHVEEQKKTQAAAGLTEESPSVLAMLGLDTPQADQAEQADQLEEPEQPELLEQLDQEPLAEQELEEEQQVALATGGTPEEQAEVARKLGVLADPAMAATVAAQVGIDPVLLMDEKSLGSSDQAKEQGLGEEGRALIDEKVGASVASLGSAALDGTGSVLVAERIQENLEVKDILEARRQGRLDELLDQAMRDNALRSRDEVIFLLQQLMNDQGEMRTVLASADPASVAVQLIEYLAVMLVDLGDLYSLAAYDHGDILRKIVISDEAVNVQRTLSPMALRMGGFSSVMYQLVVNELALRPLKQPGGGAGGPAGELAAEDPSLLVGPFRQNLYSLVNQMRLFRTSAA